MVMAIQSLSQILTHAQLRITTASVVLAQLRARNAVKAELRKFGIKASHLTAKEISSWAIERSSCLTRLRLSRNGP